MSTVCGMRVGGTAVELCQDLHKEFDDNNQRLSCIDGLPCCFNGYNEASCECQNCTLCDKRTAGSLTLNSDYTKNGQWVGPHCLSCDMDMFFNGLHEKSSRDAALFPFVDTSVSTPGYTEGGTRHKW